MMFSAASTAAKKSTTTMLMKLTQTQFTRSQNLKAMVVSQQRLYSQFNQKNSMLLNSTTNPLNRQSTLIFSSTPTRGFFGRKKVPEEPVAEEAKADPKEAAKEGEEEEAKPEAAEETKDDATTATEEDKEKPEESES